MGKIRLILAVVLTIVVFVVGIVIGTRISIFDIGWTETGHPWLAAGLILGFFALLYGDSKRRLKKYG